MILLEFLYCLSALQLSPVLYSTLPSDVRLPLTLHVSFKIKIVVVNIRHVKGNTQHGVVSLPFSLPPRDSGTSHVEQTSYVPQLFFGRQLSIAVYIVS